MEVGLGPGDIVLDGDPAPPPQQGCGAPIFGPCLFWPNCCMDQNSTWHGGGPRSRPHCARWGPSSLSPKKGVEPPIFSPFLLWPNGWMHQDATSYGGRPPGDIMLDGCPAYPHKRAQTPSQIFGSCVLWPNGCMYQDTTWYGGRPQPRRHCVRRGLSSPPPPKERTAPQFSAHLDCGQMAVCIRIPLGMEVGLGPGDFVFDGYPAPPEKKAQPPPNFGPCVLGPNGWMDQDATWYGGRPRPRRHCVRWGPSSP